jgi:predicted lactoylglutathione lyase
MDGPTHSLTAIIPCNDLDASEAFYNRLGFFQDPESANEHADYRMLADAGGATVHLTTAVEGWVVPGRNPFGVYLYTDDVDGLAARVRDDIIGRDKAPEHKEWGMYEFALSDPDGVLVRVGWPSRLVDGTA